MTNKSLVLHSGGLDSTTCLAMAVISSTEVVAVHFRYGQKHSIELERAKKICEYYHVKSVEVDLPMIFAGGGSTLIDPELDNPELSYEEIRASQGPSPTYVPFRNANLIAAAISIAQIEKASKVYFGAHADDAHNWAYPDCTPEFIYSMQAATWIGTYHEVRLEAPFMFESKSDIVTIGEDLRVPFSLTYSCYNGGEIHCGVCPTCVSRKEAFREAKVTDPTEYLR